MKKGLKKLLIEEEENILEEYMLLFEKDQSNDETENETSSNDETENEKSSNNETENNDQTGTGRIAGSQTASGDEMFYVFALPAIGTPIRKENIAFHNDIFKSELTYVKEEKKGSDTEENRINVHTSLNFIPWLIFKDNNEFDKFKRKAKTFIGSNPSAEGDNISGLQQLFNSQVSRKGTSDKDEQENKSNNPENPDYSNIFPVSHTKLKQGSKKLAIVLNSRIGDSKQAIDDISKMEDKVKQGKLILKLYKEHPLGAVNKQKLKQLINLDIPVSVDKSITVNLNPVSMLPKKDLKPGLSQIDYKLFEKLQIVFFVLQEEATNIKEALNNFNNLFNNRNYYFHNNTITENLNILEAISSTETAYLPLPSGEKEEDSSYGPVAESGQMKLVKKHLIKYNLVSKDSDFTKIWSDEYKERFIITSESRKQRQVRRAEEPKNFARSKLKHFRANDEKHKFMYSPDSEIINYKKLKKLARLEIKKCYHAIVDQLEEGDKDESYEKLNGIIGAAMGWNLFVDGGVGGLISSSDFAGSVAQPFFSSWCGPFIGLGGISMFYTLGKQLGLGDMLVDQFKSMKYFQFPWKKQFANSIIEAASEIKNTSEDYRPNLFESDDTVSGFSSDWKVVDDIFKKNKILWHRKVFSEAAADKADAKGDGDGRFAQFRKDFVADFKRDRTWSSERQRDALIEKSKKELPDLFNTLFGIKLTSSGRTLTRDEKDKETRENLEKSADEEIKAKTIENLEKIPYGSSFESINSGVHFVRYFESFCVDVAGDSNKKMFKKLLSIGIDKTYENKVFIDKLISNDEKDNLTKVIILSHLTSHDSSFSMLHELIKKLYFYFPGSTNVPDNWPDVLKEQKIAITSNICRLLNKNMVKNLEDLRNSNLGVGFDQILGIMDNVLDLNSHEYMALSWAKSQDNFLYAICSAMAMGKRDLFSLKDFGKNANNLMFSEITHSQSGYPESDQKASDVSRLHKDHSKELRVFVDKNFIVDAVNECVDTFKNIDLNVYKKFRASSPQTSGNKFETKKSILKKLSNKEYSPLINTLYLFYTEGLGTSIKQTDLRDVGDIYNGTNLIENFENKYVTYIEKKKSNSSADTEVYLPPDKNQLTYMNIISNIVLKDTDFKSTISDFARDYLKDLNQFESNQSPYLGNDLNIVFLNDSYEVDDNFLFGENFDLDRRWYDHAYNVFKEEFDNASDEMMKKVTEIQAKENNGDNADKERAEFDDLKEERDKISVKIDDLRANDKAKKDWLNKIIKSQFNTTGQKLLREYYNDNRLQIDIGLNHYVPFFVVFNDMSTIEDKKSLLTKMLERTKNEAEFHVKVLRSIERFFESKLNEDLILERIRFDFSLLCLLVSSSKVPGNFRSKIRAINGIMRNDVSDKDKRDILKIASSKVSLNDGYIYNKTLNFLISK